VQTENSHSLVRLIVASPSPRMTNHPWNERGHVNDLNFGGL